jgi:hypothetical protein
MHIQCVNVHGLMYTGEVLNTKFTVSGRNYTGCPKNEDTKILNGDLMG